TKGQDSPNRFNADVISRFAQYEKTILVPCVRDQEACRSLGLVAKDIRYSQVLLTLTQVLPLDPERKWNYSLYALDMNGVRLAPDYQQIFFANAKSYLDAIPRDGSKGAALKVQDVGTKLQQIVSS